MVLVYVLAVIGLAALVVLAAAALAVRVEESGEDDPYDRALVAAARIHSGAWEAINELRQLGSSAPSDVPDESEQKS
jgi:hypothetical protein